MQHGASAVRAAADTLSDRQYFSKGPRHTSVGSLQEVT